jgi:glycosyltransferase involved in cell wall biosynthesis
MDKEFLSPEYFRESFVESSIYRNLPSPKDGQILPADIKPPIDSLGQLNILHGGPLSNRYVFVVCFRNIGNKLKRCLKSICRQAGHYDYGVVLVDDASSDSSALSAVSALDENDIPYVLVANENRKYFTRNLYNAVNLLVEDPETVVIELDGDDYLEDVDVLGILNEAYELGALKTFGSFRCIPENSEQANHIDMFRTVPRLNDTGSPWDLDACVSWLHLKTYRKKLFMKVPLVYFWEKGGGGWLKMAEDLVVHPKMVELAMYRTAFIEDVLYVYDVSGEDHDLEKSDRVEYILNKLHRRPYGSFIYQCLRTMAKKRRRVTNGVLHSSRTEAGAGGR